jgi:competence protein ComEA
MGFTQQERNGIILFLILSTAIILLPRFVNTWTRDEMQSIGIKPIDTDSIISEYRDYEEGSAIFGVDQNPQQLHSQFSFDPNVLGYDSLLLLGFEPIAARTLIKARSNGFKIRKIQDLLSMRNMDIGLIESLRHLIKLEDSKQNIGYEKAPYVKVQKQINAIEINSADSLAWEQLPKVGGWTIVKIMKHKKALGGFLTIRQLVDDNVVPDSIYSQIAPFLSVEPVKINKLNINTSSYKDLIKHPYFDQKTINSIQKYQKQNGPLKDPKDIRKIISISKDVGERIFPYIKVE